MSEYKIDAEFDEAFSELNNEDKKKVWEAFVESMQKEFEQPRRIKSIFDPES